MNDIKVVVCGPVDAGKSSLIGVLNNGILDDGRGRSRNLVLKHHHEISSGRTSNITVNTFTQIINDNRMNINKNGKLVNSIKISNEIEYRDKLINLIDLAGHEKYLKTTVFGMLAYYPDYGIVVIGANTGITKLTKEHLGIMLYLKIPFSIVITKIDIAPPKIYLNLKKKLSKLLKNIGKNLVYINKDEDSKFNKYLLENNFTNNIPIISVSNKLGTNIDKLNFLLNKIPRINQRKIDLGLVSIDSTFQVPGIGLIVCGTNLGNKIKVRDKCYLGPCGGKFYQVSIRSIHNCLREDVLESESGSYHSFAIKFTNSKEVLLRKQIKKGMVLVDNLLGGSELVTNKFKAEVKILHHSTMIKDGYCPLIHVGPIRQSARIRILNKDFLKSGDKAILEFKFIYRPELIQVGQTLFFRDGITKGVGTISELL